MKTPSTTHSQKNYTITIIGCGTVGSLMAYHLKKKGYLINCLINRSLDSAKRLAGRLQISNYGCELNIIPKETNLIFISTPDSSISEVAEQLSKCELKFNKLSVVHFSGALSTDILKPLLRKGAAGVSMHPFQTFAKIHTLTPVSGDVFNCYFGLQASDPDGFELGKQLVHALGGKAMYIPKESKTLYHIAGVLISNYTVTLTHLASEIFSSLGLSQSEAFQVFEPIMKQTLDNLKSSPHIYDALTGPIERGDINVLKKHLDELETQMPHLIPAYATFAMETVRVAIQKGSLNPGQAGELLQILGDALVQESKTTLS